MKPSWALTLSLSFLYLLAAICIALISLPIGLKVIALAVLIFVGVKAIKQHALFATDASIIKLNGFNPSNNKCKIKLKNGKKIQVNLISAECLFGYFIVLAFKDNANKYKITIAKDMVSQEQFYALRLYLRSLIKLR